MSSIKDRIKFFENLKNSEEPNIIPKPLPTKIPNKLLETRKPTIDQIHKPQTHHIQQEHSSQIHLKSLHKEPAETILANSVKTIVPHQAQKPSGKADSNPDKESSIGQQTIINVKNLKNMFQKKDFPIVQQPITLKSCLVPSKKSPFQEKKQTHENNNQAVKQTEERRSLPENISIDNGQKKLSFQQMRRIAQLTLAKTKSSSPLNTHQAEQIVQKQSEQIPQKNPETYSSQNHQQDSQHEGPKIKVYLQQQTQNLEEQTYGQSEKPKKNESNIIFNDIFRQQSQSSNTLVTGQSNSLNLVTRKTVARRRNNDDDFDDL